MTRNGISLDLARAFEGLHAEADQHFKDLLDASSLGTPAAGRIRASTPNSVVDDVRRRLMRNREDQQRSPLPASGDTRPKTARQSVSQGREPRPLSLKPLELAGALQFIYADWHAPAGPLPAQGSDFDVRIDYDSGIVVVGEVKSGKPTLVNMLLSHGELCPAVESAAPKLTVNRSGGWADWLAALLGFTEQIGDETAGRAALVRCYPSSDGESRRPMELGWWLADTPTATVRLQSAVSFDPVRWLDPRDPATPHPRFDTGSTAPALGRLRAEGHVPPFCGRSVDLPVTATAATDRFAWLNLAAWGGSRNAERVADTAIFDERALCRLSNRPGGSVWFPESFDGGLPLARQWPAGPQGRSRLQRAAPTSTGSWQIVLRALDSLTGGMPTLYEPMRDLHCQSADGIWLDGRQGDSGTLLVIKDAVRPAGAPAALARLLPAAAVGLGQISPRSTVLSPTGGPAQSLAGLVPGGHVFLLIRRQEDITSLWAALILPRLHPQWRWHEAACTDRAEKAPLTEEAAMAVGIPGGAGDGSERIYGGDDDDRSAASRGRGRQARADDRTGRAGAGKRSWPRSARSTSSAARAAATRRRPSPR